MVFGLNFDTNLNTNNKNVVNETSIHVLYEYYYNDYLQQNNHLRHALVSLHREYIIQVDNIILT